MNSKIAFLLLCFLGLQQHLVWAQETEQTIKTPIESVKIYLQGAETVHRAKVSLVAGKNKLIFTDLSPKIYDKTIQTVLGEGIRLLSITSKTNFLKRREDSPQIRTLRDSVEQLRQKIDLIDAERESYEEQKALMVSNRSIKPNEKADSDWISELDKTADFFRKELFEINKALLQLERRWVEHNRRLFDFKLQMHELNAGQQPTSEIYLVVEAPQATTTEISLRYLVADAGWMPLYDLYAGDISQPIELRYRGLAYNNTGVDWKEVKLSLSTADPMQSATQPQLLVWDVNSRRQAESYSSQNITVQNNDVQYQLNPFQKQEPYKTQTVTYSETEIVVDVSFIRQILGSDYKENIDYETDLYRRYQSERKPKADAQFTTIELPELNAVFEIDRPYTIPSDKKPYSIDISTSKLQAKYQYLAVPKLDRDAFLMAAVMGWEDLDLVSGPVNIYNEQRYLGQSFIDIRNISDTLFVSLGRDPSIVVTRVKVKGSTRKQFLSGYNKASTAFNITVKNNKAKSINIEVQDQFPISNNKEVVVTLDESSNADITAEIGLLSWKFSLDPGQEKTMSLGFSVKYPKEQEYIYQRNIQYNRSRRLGCPAF